MKNIKIGEILVSSVSKAYDNSFGSRKSLFSFAFNNKRKKYWSIKDLSFMVKKGERIGIIGENGAGKTTLLKLISGITYPTSGRCQYGGKLVSLIDLSAGFHPDLSGRNNIVLNSILLGYSLDEVNEKINKIIDFCDIGSYIDKPLFTYSTGMKLRLGFSIVAYSDPDILLFDEGIATGDEGFRKKISCRMKMFYQKKVTMIIASHWLDFVRAHCTRLIWLSKGEIFDEGGKELLLKYKEAFKNRENVFY